MALSQPSQETEYWVAALRVIDVSDPMQPFAVYTGKSNDPGSYSSDLVLKGDLVFMAGDLLRIFEISDPASPNFISFFPTRCDKLAISGDFAYLTLDRLMVLYVINPRDPHWAYSYSSEWPKSVAVSGNRVFLGGSLKILKNTRAPTLSIVSPRAHATVLGAVQIEVKASHSTGIRNVQLYIDDSIVATMSTPPYAYTWDTTSEDDSTHTIHVRATNNNWLESEAEIQVITRLVYTPLYFAGQKTLNRSLSQAEYINVLSWQTNPHNSDVAKYWIYRVEGKDHSLLAELTGDTVEYRHRGVTSDGEYTYALVAVNHQNRVSDPVSVTIK